MRAGGQLNAENVTLLELIRIAYDMDTYRIFEGPDWIRRDRFDVQARAGANVTREDTRLMLRTTLADRFKLRVRSESRDMPIYALVAVRRDGGLGPRLRMANPAECMDRGPQPGRVPAGALPSCGLLPQGPGRLNGRSVPIPLLLTQLSSITGRVVRDRSGLSGLFDIDLDWGLTESQVAALAQLTPVGGTPPVFDPDRPTLFTAIQEQLGLRLESATGPVDVVVVESAERPTEN
jgi:uncharacterized protein (TIGR03435 family)